MNPFSHPPTSSFASLLFMLMEIVKIVNSDDNDDLRCDFSRRDLDYDENITHSHHICSVKYFRFSPLFECSAQWISTMKEFDKNLAIHINDGCELMTPVKEVKTL